jgi:L-fuculose-phosphate aldolase
LQFSPNASEGDLRAAIIETGRLAYQTGLMISNDGNISVRMPDGHILITPSGVCKGRINPEDLLIIDIDGRLIKTAADPSMKPTSEQPMHLEVYRRRPDVRAVIHTHLIFANALVIAKGKIRMDVIPEAAASFGSIPVTGFAMPSSLQNAEAIRELIGAHDVIMIRNHGCLAVGHDLDQALIRVERVEHIAKILTFAELLGDVNTLPYDPFQRIDTSVK